MAKRALSFFVNMRGRTAAKVIQRASNLFTKLMPGLSGKLVVDGFMGDKTIHHINVCPNSELLINLIRLEAAKVYISIVNKNPDQFKFINGWLNRARS